MGRGSGPQSISDDLAVIHAIRCFCFKILPNDLSLDDWYAGVYALPTVWPDVSMMGINNLRRVVGYDFHHLRKKYDAPSMWGNIRPRWRLLQQHLETKGPGWYSLAEREERLFTNRSNRPGDDMKDELRTDHDSYAWSTWRTAQDQLWQLRQPALPVELPGEQVASQLAVKTLFPSCIKKT